MKNNDALRIGDCEPQHSRLSRHLFQKRKEKLVALGHLAAGVAHEIRNPLSSIKGLAKYFAERAPAGGEAHQLAQVMAKEADRLNRVVSELLELVKPTHLALQAVDLNTLINHSLQQKSCHLLSALTLRCNTKA